MRPAFVTARIALLLLCFGISPVSRAYSLPQPTAPGTSGTTISELQLKAAEQKLLQRTFEHDPIDKRLQRLELLVFGATQFGSDSERWLNLQRAVNGSQSGKTYDTASLDAIEKQVFKKTSPNLSTTARLSQIETKMFGQANPGLPTRQRIERLEKTLGVAANPFSSPRTALKPFANMPPSGTYQLPNGSFTFRFFGDPNQMRTDPQMGQMMQEMDRQMREFERFGFRSFDQDEPDDLNPGEMMPHQMIPREMIPRPVVPSHPRDNTKALPPGLKVPPSNVIPPYGDPNSI